MFIIETRERLKSVEDKNVLMRASSFVIFVQFNPKLVLHLHSYIESFPHASYISCVFFDISYGADFCHSLRLKN